MSGPVWRGRAGWCGWLLGACCLVPFAAILSPDGRTLPDGSSRDFVAYQLPIREYARGEMLAGRFPLWIAYLGAGLPLHAGQQASLCHPLLMPLVLLFGASYGLKLCLFSHFVIGYVGAYWVARFHDISVPASSLAAVIATWSGFAVNHLMAGHVTLLLQYFLVPWFWLALVALLRQPGVLPAVGLAGVGFVLAVSGHPQVFYYTALLGGLWVGGSLLAGVARAARAAFVAWVLAAIGLVILTSSVQFLPSIELMRDGMSESFRSKTTFAEQDRLTGLDMVRLLAPNAAGNPFRGPKGSQVGENFHERVVYLGLATPFLAFYGLSRGGAPRWSWGAAWLLMFAFAISLGSSTPLFGWLLRVVPGLGLFRCPGRVFGAASMLAALLAARGLDALLMGERRMGGSRRLAWVALIWCMSNLAGWALLENKDGVRWHSSLEFAREHLVADAMVFAILAAGTLALLCFAWRHGRKNPRAAYSLIVVLVLVDLWWNNVRNFGLESPATTKLPAALVAQRLPRRFVEAPVATRLNIDHLRYSRLVPAAIASGRQLLGTMEGGVLPASTERLFRALQMNPGAVLPLAGCDYSCSPANGGCEPLSNPLPRLRFFTESDAALVDLPIEDVRDEHVRQMRERISGNIRIVEETPARIVLDVDFPAAGRLVLADAWYPSWNVSINGMDAKVDRAHAVFRSVRIAGGQNRVVFKYEPLAFRQGLIGSAVGIILWCGLLVFGLRRRVVRV